MKRRELFKAGALAAASISTVARAAESSNDTQDRSKLVPQKITAIETFIIRHPPDRDKPEDFYISMPPVGQMTGGIGLQHRLDHAETVRQKGYQQTLLVKITTAQGVVGWGEAHAVMTPRWRSSAESCPTRFNPPRILNAPVGLWFSCLTQMSSASASSSSGCLSRGDGCMTRYTRDPAPDTSRRVGGMRGSTRRL